MQVFFNYGDKKLFPDFPESLPNELFNEEWAQHIHSQTLKRLNERGGLHPCEMIGNIKKLSCSEIGEYNTKKAIEELIEILNNYKNNE
jgi:hypothetical protein